MLRARREEERLVGDAEQRDQHDARPQLRGRQLRREQRVQQEDLVRGVEHHVEPAPADPAEHRNAGEQRQLRRARAQEVEEAAERRVEARVHRPHAAAEAHQLVEDRPEHRLLERDRREGPAARRGEARIAGREGDEERPAADVEHQVLRPVQDQHDGRVRVHLRRPRAAHEAHALGERSTEEARRFVGRKIGDAARRHAVEPRAGWSSVRGMRANSRAAARSTTRALVVSSKSVGPCDEPGAGAGRGCCSGARRRGVRSGWRREGPFELYRRPFARSFARMRRSSRRLAHARLARPLREAPSRATVASRTAPAHPRPPSPWLGRRRGERAPRRSARTAAGGRRPGIERRATARHATHRRIRIAKHCGDQRAPPDARRRETEDRRPPAAGRAPAVTNAPGLDT